MLFRILINWLRARSRGGAAAGGAAGGGGSSPAGAAPSIEQGARAMSLELANVTAVARREYLARARTRTFKVTTVILVIAAIALALAPVLIRWVDRNTGGGATTIEVSVGDAAPQVDVGQLLTSLFNAQSQGSGPLTSGSQYTVTMTSDVAGAKARVDSGKSGGLLILARVPEGSTTAIPGDLSFTFVTNARALDRLSQVMRVAATTIAQADRLYRAGITTPIEQAKLFAPPPYATEKPNGQPGATDTAESYLNQFAIGFVLSIVLFMAIILYGQWVAYSVAEEKSSRVMEVILGAASPLELLAGKVAGVGGLALTQYAIIFVPALVLVALQDQLAGLILGEPAAAAALPAGLSVQLLVTFGVMFILGFALYSVLYAGAAALVSRTEDINSIVAPMTLVSTAGYLVAVYSSTGLIPPDATFVHVMAQIPFFSPYLVLSLMGSNAISPLEVITSVVILAAFVPLALWFAARLYAAGVLMYGQRPSLKLLVRVFSR